ncbi:MAG TPA: heme-binding protein [Candidatus Polarisedimenticolaceae bacterium]
MRAGVLGLALMAAWGTVMATEEPSFEVVKAYEDFEVRLYDPYVIAETEVDGAFEKAGNAGFRVLFRYIDRGNARSESIAMTAPVTQSAKEGRTVVGFVMPAGSTLDTLPAPADARIRMREVPSRRVAAIRYSGSWSEARFREHEAALRVALEREGLRAAGEPIWARYNAPFVPWFLRRNEVLLEVAPEEAN